MIDSLSALQRRMVALALLGLGVALTCLAILAPIADFVGIKAGERAADLRALSRDRALLAQDQSVRASLDLVARSARWARLYESEKPEKAVLQIEADLREILKSPNNPTSMVAQPARVKGPLTQLAVKVTLSMPINQWTESLVRLQSLPRLLQIDNIVVQAPDYQIIDTNPNLAIQAEIIGYMVTPAGTQDLNSHGHHET